MDQKQFATRKVALLLGKIEHEVAREAIPGLREYGVVSELSDGLSAHYFWEYCDQGRFQNVVVMYRTFKSVEMTGPIDDRFLDRFPKSLKFICHNGAGYDQIDVDACTRRGVHVSNTPTAVDDATADTSVFLTLGALRNFPVSIAALKRGEWRGSPLPALGHDPQGKILGILGMGGIGRNYARKMRAFDMTVIYHNRNPLSEEEADGAKYVSFDELLRTSDVLSLNLPLNRNTRGIIGKKELETMKRSAIIINTARGAVIDELALIDALERETIAGAGLDVYENEPDVPERLYRNDRVMILPHMGTWSKETQGKMELLALDNVKSALQNGELITRVPEQKNLKY